MVEEAVGGPQGAAPFLARQDSHKWPRQNVESAQPHRHHTFAAVVEEGGRQEVAVGHTPGAESPEDLERVTLVPLLHRREQAPFAGQKGFLCLGYYRRIERRPQGVQALADAVEDAAGHSAYGHWARAGLNR